MKPKKYFLIYIFVFSALVLSASEYKNYFIETLKKQSFKPNNITIERTVKENNFFTSFVASYYSDGLKQYALLNIPKLKKEKLPVVIVNHGYVPPKKYSVEKSYVLVTDYYASSGFITIKPDYRGHDKSEGDAEDRMTRLAYPVDVLNLIYALTSLKNADTENVFVYGHSMGGQVTLTVLEVFDKIRAATLWAPVSIEFPENSLYFLRKRDKEGADKLGEELKKILSKDDFKKLSANNYLSLIKTPVILHHGYQDESVPYKWSEDLARDFKKNNVMHEFYSYNDDHNFTKKYFYAVLKKDVEFFRKFIKK